MFSCLWCSRLLSVCLSLEQRRRRDTTSGVLVGNGHGLVTAVSIYIHPHGPFVRIPSLVAGTGSARGSLENKRRRRRRACRRGQHCRDGPTSPAHIGRGTGGGRYLCRSRLIDHSMKRAPPDPERSAATTENKKRIAAIIPRSPGSKCGEVSVSGSVIS